MRTYMRDGSGALIPPGSVRHQFTASALLDATLPAWATSSGTFSRVAAVATTPAYYQAITAATNGSAAQLFSATAIPLGAYKAVLFELDAFRMTGSSMPADIQIGINGSGGVGGYMLQRSTDALPQLYSGGITLGTGTEINRTFRTNGEGILPHNIGLFLDTVTKELLLLENGQVTGYRDCSAAYVSGNATPNATITTREAVAYGIRVAGMRVTCWQ